MCITHRVFFLGICKDAFNRFFAPLVEFLVLRCVSGVVGQLLIVFPDMSLHGFYEILRMGTALSGWTRLTNPWIAFVFAVAVPVGCCVVQRLVFRTDDAIIVFVIDVLPPFVSALHRLGTLIRCGKDSAIVKDVFANMGRFVSTVGYDCLDLRKTFGYFLIHLVKCYTVMDIAGRDYGFQYETVLVAGGMGFIGKLLLVFAFYK